MSVAFVWITAGMIVLALIFGYNATRISGAYAEALLPG